jgi:hypothetical protein
LATLQALVFEALALEHRADHNHGLRQALFSDAPLWRPQRKMIADMESADFLSIKTVLVML